MQLPYELVRDGLPIFKSQFVTPKSLVYDIGTIREYDKKLWPYVAASKSDPTVGAPLLSTTVSVGVAGNHDTAEGDLTKSPDLLAYFYFWSQPRNGPITNPNDPRATPLSGPATSVAAFRANAGDAYPRATSFSFDYANSHWLVLDMNDFMHWDDPKLRAWVTADLAHAQKATWRFVAVHQPGFHSSEKHQTEKQLRLLADIFEDQKVDIVFAGHVHNYQRTWPIEVGTKRGADRTELEKDDWAVDKSFDGVNNQKPKGVIYVVSGAGGAYLYNPELESQPDKWKPFQRAYFARFSFSSISVNGSKLTFDQIGVDGKSFDAFAISKD